MKKKSDEPFYGSVPDQSSITLPSEPLVDSVPNKPNSNRSKILGGTLGTLAGLLIVGLIFFFLHRRRRAQHNEEEGEFEKPIQSPSLVEHSPINPTTIAPISMGDSKAQLLMTYDDGGPSTISPSSETGPRAGEGSTHSNSSQQQQMRLVPQRAAHLHVTNLAPGEEKPLPSPSMTPKPQPEERQTQDENLRREVERLRVEMEAIRAGQQQPRVTEEPPPRYAES